MLSVMNHADYTPLPRKSSDWHDELDATYVHTPTRHTFGDDELEEDEYNFGNQDGPNAVLLEELHSDGIPKSRSRATEDRVLDDSPAAMVRRVSA